MRREFLWRGGVALVGLLVAGCIDVSELIFDRDQAKGCERTFTRAAASSLHDDFSTGAADTTWSHDPTCAVYQNSQAVSTADPHFGCGFSTPAAYHLTCDSITVKVPQRAAPEVQTYLYATQSKAPGDGGLPDQLQILLTSGFQVGTRTTPPLDLTDASYDHDLDAWWRVREDGGTLTLETSVDGITTWRQKGSGVVSMSLDEVNIELGAGYPENQHPTNPGAASFDCYNVAPGDCK
jgi:hypothetical protein